MKMSKNLYMKKIGEKAKLASLHLSSLNIDRRNSVLKQFNQYLKTNVRSILNSNKKNNLFKNVHSLHFFPLGGIEASAAFARNIDTPA